jgi:putative transposase
MGAIMNYGRSCGCGLREIAQSRVRYGYLKIRVLLNREGWDVGNHLVYRLYKEESLALKNRPQRKRKTVRHREEGFTATASNQAWSIDFIADQLQDGTRFRALTMVDVYTRESVAIEVGCSTPHCGRVDCPLQSPLT